VNQTSSGGKRTRATKTERNARTACTSTTPPPAGLAHVSFSAGKPGPLRGCSLFALARRIRWARGSTVLLLHRLSLITRREGKATPLTPSHCVPL
jgi:hypothetical protein